MLWMKLFLQLSSFTYLSPDFLSQLLVPVAAITSISHVHLSPHYFSNLCDRLRSMGQYEDRWCLVLGGGSTGNRWGLLASSGRVWKWMLACAGGNGSGRSCVMEVGGGGGRWRQWSLLEANGRYWWKSVAGEGSWGYL